MRQILPYFQLRRINKFLEKALLIGIHHLHILLIRPHPDIIDRIIGRYGLIFLNYLRCKLLLHGVLHNGQLRRLFRYLLWHIYPHSFVISTLVQSLCIFKTDLWFSLACHLSLFANFVDEGFSVLILIIRFDFFLDLFGVYLYLVVERLSDPVESLGWWLIRGHADFVVLFVGEIVVCFYWSWTGFDLVQICNNLASILHDELFPLLSQDFMERFSSDPCQSWAAALSLQPRTGAIMLLIRRIDERRLPCLVVCIWAEISSRYLLRLIEFDIRFFMTL